MDNQNGAAQLRYLEEIGTRLRRMDFETTPIEKQHPLSNGMTAASAVFQAEAVYSLYRQESVIDI